MTKIKKLKELFLCSHQNVDDFRKRISDLCGCVDEWSHKRTDILINRAVYYYRIVEAARSLSFYFRSTKHRYASENEIVRLHNSIKVKELK